MSYPKSREEWWKLVDDNWVDLLEILGRFLPMSGNEDIDQKILVNPLYLEIEKIKTNKDSKLARYFQAAWFAAPDVSSLHGIPGWLLLCDLCSEDYLVNED